MIYNKEVKHSKIKLKDWFTILFYLIPYFKMIKFFDLNKQDISLRKKY